jgi:aminoglycoside 3-N-acetyltransferase I
MTQVRRLGASDPADMRVLNALFARAFEDSEQYPARGPDDGYLAEALAKPHVVALVAQDAGEIVGGLVAYEFDKLEQARRELYIYDLAVEAAHRRRGIATALISDLRRHAAERGAWVVYVQADHGDDPAVALYTKLGTREDVMHFDMTPLAG